MIIINLLNTVALTEWNVLYIMPHLSTIFFDGNSIKCVFQFLQALPSSQSVKVCKGVLKKLESTSALKFVANYLLEHCRATEESKYRKTLVGVDILKVLESKDRVLYIHLIKEPLLMLEQLLMNCKFESIHKILTTLREDLQHPDVGIGNFDKVIRLYAKKSLDFRVSLQRDGMENKGRNVPQSNLEVENGEFVMPVNVPTKEEWVPNDKVNPTVFNTFATSRLIHEPHGFLK